MRIRRRIQFMKLLPLFLALGISLSHTTCAPPPAEPEPEAGKPAAPSAGQLYQQAVNTQNPEEKIDLLSRAIESNPAYETAWMERGKTYSELGDFKSAVADFSTVLAKNPESAEALFERAHSFQNMLFWQKALADYSSAIEIDPRGGLYAARADCYLAHKEYANAIPDYTKAIAMDTQNAELYTNRGVCYQKLSEYDKAIADYQRASRLKPEEPSLYYNLGSIYWELGEWSKVLGAWQKCLDIDPDYGNIKMYLPTVRKRAIGKH